MTTSWLQPDWPVPTVHAVCSTRQGGASHAPYDSLNLGDHVGDVPQDVQSNRRRFAQALNVRPVFLQQVHGWDLVSLTKDTPDATVADACITTYTDVACTIIVADCLPVLFTDPLGRVVGAAHAGWRGLAGAEGVGVLETTVQALRESLRAQQQADTVWAWLGPCIGPTRFEVGAEVRAAFVTAQPQASQAFVPHAEAPGKYWADLALLARQRLQALGVTQVWGNDGSPRWCTVLNTDLFFSHRRDRVSGRFAAAIRRQKT